MRVTLGSRPKRIPMKRQPDVAPSNAHCSAFASETFLKNGMAALSASVTRFNRGSTVGSPPEIES
jgi:hypothetical protein